MGKNKKTFQVLFHTLETSFIKGFVLKKANESPPESIDFQTFAMVGPPRFELGIQDYESCVLTY